MDITMKATRIFLILALAVCLTTATACHGGEPAETTAADTTSAPTESSTEASTQAPAEDVEVKLTVVDQNGNPVSEAVVTILPADEEESTTLTADAQGSITVELPAGNYTVRFDVLPQYVLGIDTPLTVTAGMEPVTLTVTDNTPDGSEEHPFVVTEDRVSVTIPADTTYHFTMFGAHNRTLTVQNPNVEVTYKDTVYTPDANGLVSIRLSTDSPRDPTFFALTNKGSEECDLTVSIYSDPGTMDNPIVIEELNTAVTAQVPQDGMMHYRWTASADGTLTVSSADAINNISLQNIATSQVSDFSNGGESVSLAVKQGDTITIVVAVIGGDSQAETNPVTFTLSLSE